MKITIPQNIASITPYPPGKPLEELEREYGITNAVKMASNENAWGPSPKAVRAIRSVMLNLHRYPDASCHSLVAALAEKMGLTPAEIVLGNGSNEVIDLLVKAFVTEGDEAITSHPSFLMYQKFVQARGGVNYIVPLKEMKHDLAVIREIISEKTRLIFLDNPNNPTGTAIAPVDLYQFLSDIPDSVIVVLDEAYIDFTDRNLRVDVYSLIRNAERRCPVVFLRTFSKVYGLAGLRIGFGMMAKEIADCLHKVRQPFNINQLAQVGALSALADEEHYQKTVLRTGKGMKYLQAEVTKVGCTPYPSQTNFFLIDVGGNADAVYNAMLGRGVIVRSMSAYGFPDFIRVTVGTDEENGRFLKALAECLTDCTMSEKKNIIAIDGPSGVGKSTVSRKIAAAVGFTYLDTGAMYRAVGLYLSRLQTDLEDTEQVRRTLDSLTLELLAAVDEESDVRVMINGEDVSEAVRTPEMAMVASRVSANETVREYLTRIQKSYGAAGKIVAEGRDIGTVVFPDAAYKFFLDAHPEERARRRVEQLQRKGIEADFGEILAMTLERDHQDRNREVAPLRRAYDALLIDTTGIGIEEVVGRILAAVRRKDPAPTGERGRT